uniref:Odorant receptor n=1 Tax=Protaetia brevitarsis TaxID=348688 RepID=A0A411HQZ9_PROBE|nr:odorant receptor [Protaetia brevitarsis]
MAGGIRSWIRAYKQKELPKNYFRAQVKILRFLGVELMRDETIKYRIYSCIMLFIVAIQGTFSEAVEFYAQWGDLNAIVNVTSYLFTHSIGIIKVMMLFYNRKKFGKMIKTLHNKPFAPEVNRGGDIEEKYLRQIVRTTERQLMFFFVLTYVTLFTAAVTFIKSRVFDPKEEWQYPYVPITIIKTTDSPLFEMVGVYEVIWVSLYAGLLITTDILLVTILAHLTIQFMILNNAFKTIRTRSKRMNQNADGTDENEGVILSKLLGEYIEHHLRVLELAEEMEELCNMVYLLIFTSSVILLCFLLFQMSLYPIGSVEFIHNISYYGIIAYQIGMYCFWGNEVTLQAEEVAVAVAEADWVGAPRSVMKAMVVIIARSQKPLYMTAGKFVNLSIDTFMRVIKGSFSYFMVLQQTQEETT